MPLSRSAHVDTFTRDRLPPQEQWPELRFDLPELDYPDRLNCAVRLLDETIERIGPDQRCLVTDTEAWTYGRLLERANQVADVLSTQLGLVPGNRVLLRAPNNPWLVATWLGVLKAGGVVVLTMPLLRPAELVTTIELTLPRLAICDHRFLADLHTARDQAAPALPVVAFGGVGQDDLVARAGTASTGFEAVDTAADDVALLALTSGTTGRPKVTMHFHRDVLAIADTFSRHVLQPEPYDLFTTTAPFAFTFGLGAGLVFPLHTGAATLLIEKATPDELADAVARHGVTALFTAPTAYKAMVAAGKDAQLRSVRRAVSAGEHLPEAIWRSFYEATDVRIIDGIGSTEMLHIFIASAGDEIRPGSTGRAVPGYKATVLDEDGYFWYQARNDDMIITSGYNIAGPEVEQALLIHADVAECAVVGVPDAERGQVIKAYVVLREGAPRDDAARRALQEHVKATIAPYKYPRLVEFRDALPKTQTGKLQRYKLREEVQVTGGRAPAR